jgi:cysteinyl-tRNA synthetase
MSKSLGNFFTIRDVLKVYKPEVVRFFLLSSHYRSPLNYSDENLDKARSSLERLYLALRGERAESTEGEEFAKRFFAAMDDDFNTPQAIAVLFDIAHAINTAEDEAVRAGLRERLVSLAGILGLLQQEPEDFLRSGTPGEGGLDDATIDAMVAARDAARAGRDFAEADRIRDELTDSGVVLEDGPEGTLWRRGG